MRFPYHGVLFVCRGNAIRSQMAEGLLRSAAPEGVEVWSAGASPIGLDLRAVEVMSEIGIDISGQRSKGIDDVPLARVDLVITLCEGLGDPCLNVSVDAERRHWPTADPYMAAPLGKDGMDGFRAVRDGLQDRVAALLGAVGRNEKPPR